MRELQTWYLDEDGDGFGEEAQTACQETEGFVTWRGDCNDQQMDIHPGALDATGDALDSDCGGSDDSEPHVGFAESGQTTLEDALAAVEPYETLWIAPGTYLEFDLELRVGDTLVRSVAGADETIVDANEFGRVLSIKDTLAAPVVLDGLTLTRGLVIEDDGAGLRIENSSVDLNGLRLTQNYSDGVYVEDLYFNWEKSPAGKGGGLYAVSSQLRVANLQASENRAGSGQALWLEDCYLNGQDWWLFDNEVYSYGNGGETEYGSDSSRYYLPGGALSLLRSQAALSRIEVASNHGGTGAGIYFEESTLHLDTASFFSNVASNYEFYYTYSHTDDGYSSTSETPSVGGGMHGVNSVLLATHVEWTLNEATRGAALSLDACTATVEGSSWVKNNAPVCRTSFEGSYASIDTWNTSYKPGQGAGILAKASDLILRDALFSENRANDGAGIFMQGGNLEVHSLRAETQQVTSYEVHEEYSDYHGQITGLQIGYEAGRGGVFWFEDASAELEDLDIVGCTGNEGSSFYLRSSDTRIERCTIDHGEATSFESMFRYDEYTGSFVTTYSPGMGGGIYVESGTLELMHCSLSDLHSNQGAAVSASNATVHLQHTSFRSTSASAFLQTEIQGTYPCDGVGFDYAPGVGGTLYLQKSTVEADHIEIVSSLANEGGGIAQTGGSLSLTQSAIVGARAESADMGGSEVNDCYGFDSQFEAHGGGILTTSVLSLKSSVLAHNLQSNLWAEGATLEFSYSAIYNPESFGVNYSGVSDASGLMEVEPQFLSYRDASTGQSCAAGSSQTCVPDDLHLATSSPLVNAGDPSLADVDGSRQDIGVYGGASGGSWDRDLDGAMDYFWPGEWHQAPAPFSPSDFDCDDLNPAQPPCGSEGMSAPDLDYQLLPANQKNDWPRMKRGSNTDRRETLQPLVFPL